jgi:hypothetical protein
MGGWWGGGEAASQASASVLDFRKNSESEEEKEYISNINTEN